MLKYHKIKSAYIRDPHNMRKVFVGTWSKPEFEYMQDLKWHIDEKIDGTNMRVMWDGSSVTVAGKGPTSQLHPDLITNVSALCDLQKFQSTFAPTESAEVCIYGEGYGPGIQKGGGNYRKDKSFIVFDIKIRQHYLERSKRNEVASALGLEVVPQLPDMTLHEATELCKAGFNSYFGDFMSEGVIARPKVHMTNSHGERVITKIKCKDF